MITRRGLLSGLGAVLAAPAVVRASSLMPVRGIVVPTFDEMLRLRVSDAYEITVRAVNENLYVDRWVITEGTNLLASYRWVPVPDPKWTILPGRPQQ